MKTAKQKIVALGVYDSMVATVADRIGIDILMVGPSGPMSLLGRKVASDVTVEEQIVVMRAVTRVAEYALTNAHMPYMSYQASAADAVRSAGHIVSQGGIETVKCDGNRHVARNIRAIVRAGVPVIAHIGLQASRKVEQSGYGVKGRTAVEAKSIYDDAMALVDAGVFALVVERVPTELLQLIADAVPVPTISLGSGPGGDGVCIVSGDAMNYSVFPRPVGAGVFVDVRSEIDRALKMYRDNVRAGAYPKMETAPRMPEEEFAIFKAEVS